MTQKEIGLLLGVAQQRIQEWFASDGEHNTGNGNRFVGAHVKVPPQQRPALVERVDAGETLVQVAADVGITPQHLGRIVTSETKQANAKREREEAVKAFRLHRLGWTQAEIGDLLGVDQRQISRDLDKIQEVGESAKSQLADGHAIEEAARRQGLPEILVHTIQCDGKDDARTCATSQNRRVLADLAPGGRWGPGRARRTINRQCDG